MKSYEEVIVYIKSLVDSFYLEDEITEEQYTVFNDMLDSGLHAFYHFQVLLYDIVCVFEKIKTVTDDEVKYMLDNNILFSKLLMVRYLEEGKILSKRKIDNIMNIVNLIECKLL